MAEKLFLERVNVHVSPLEEIAKVLQDGMQSNFQELSVSVVDCPDLTASPFHLAAPGLCGNPRIVDVGGPGYLLPLPQKDKKYKFSDIAQLAELPHAFMIGAGAGPCHHVGVNSELINNVKLDLKGNCENNNAHIAKVNPETNGCILESLSCPEFSLMGNFLCSEGKPGKVIEIKASTRKGDDDFMVCTRKALKAFYGEKPVALGGVFLVEKGKANLHIMPDFSKEPLNSDDEVNKWLNFYDMDAPLICLGELVSHDPGLDLRIEHFHCFSKHGQGGHYHFDTTPADVAYRAYFIAAEYLYRIDRPVHTTQHGR